MFEPIAFARELIDIPSPTEQERDAGEFLFATLKQLGYRCSRRKVAPNRFNVFASPGGRPRILINSHYDTVPPWFASFEDEQFIYGRGACDTKGIIAAMIAAGERLRGRGVDEFAFLFVVGEETDSIGAKKANETFAKLGSEYVIVGEPTESMFARASKGAMTVVARFEGRAGHSAYPERGDSAINKLVAAVAEINAMDWGTDDVLGKATVNVGVIRGGQKPNIIAGDAEAEMMFRVVSELEAVRDRLEPILKKHGGHIVLSRGNPPQLMTVPDGAKSTVVAFNTDVPHLKSLGKPLLFGPGSILDAHGPNEHIAKRELLAAVETYERTVLSLLS
ncbi:MAG TPA: M20/M25/M40 family metallo-hydrolase [Thermoanaerobaculia bacterium]|jgi:acetylornithine deacetylase|nr:M20/M25/M40 family metallo-hydrolase [Thermoanaerobaculia bacterium]